MKIDTSLVASSFVAALALLNALGTAAEPIKQTAAPATEARPALHLQVLESVEVRHSDHSVFYQRVAPPVLPARVAVAPVAKATPLSPEAMAAQEARAKKKFEVLMLSATVYDHRVTEVRWQVGEQRFRAWSNIDFNDFSGGGEIETADTIYLLIMGLGNDTAEAIEGQNKQAAARGSSWRKELPAAEFFNPKRSEYLLVDGDKAEPPPEALAPLGALHSYYDAHREKLHANAERRTAEQAARELASKPPPPAPSNEVISFWPKKSRLYPTGH